MAMNIISKDKKEIRWIGLPANSAQVNDFSFFFFTNFFLIFSYIWKLLLTISNVIHWKKKFKHEKNELN